MTTETYQFEYYGARFEVAVDVSSAVSTTDSPNLRVMSGTWKTWRLTVIDDVPGLAGLRLQKSVAAGGSQHPSGNLTPAQSAPNGYMVMCSTTGSLYGIPTGFGAVSRFYTDAAWQYQLAVWEASL